MRYLGGKARQAKRIVDIIVADTVTAATPPGDYYEPFMGGGSVAVEVAKRSVFDRLHLSDYHEDLVMMWREAVDGWIPPTDVPLEMYDQLKTAEPSALRGFVGFACSFGAKWFGGYARGGGRDWAGEGSRSTTRKAKALAGAAISHGDYRDIAPRPADAVYCDPPYACTTEYAGGFDSRGFWAWAEGLARQGAYVYVSEYTAPRGWVSIANVTRGATVNVSTVKRVEHLYVFQG